MKPYSKQIHHGTNLRRLREAKGLKQNAMAELLNISQQSISRYESLPRINDKVLMKFSSVLNIPIELIKSLQSDLATYIVENNIFKPIEALQENTKRKTLAEKFKQIIVREEKEKVALYQRLLKTEKEYNKELKLMLNTLKEIKQEVQSLKTEISKPK